MKTKELIKCTAKELFSKKGIKNITLREIANTLNKSYGNITYHFATKELLLEVLFTDMNTDLMLLQKNLPKELNLLEYFLELPEFSFDITIDYLFFYLDYVELKRNYPNFIKKVVEANVFRKIKWLQLLIELQKQEFLKEELSINDLEYIMELSTGIRMFYFQENDYEELDKAEFTKKVNQLLLPYLSLKGKKVYQNF
jgi:AcrR family transcriptional regulator